MYYINAGGGSSLLQPPIPTLEPPGPPPLPEKLSPIPWEPKKADRPRSENLLRNLGPKIPNFKGKNAFFFTFVPRP